MCGDSFIHSYIAGHWPVLIASLRKRSLPAAAHHHQQLLDQQTGHWMGGQQTAEIDVINVFSQITLDGRQSDEELLGWAATVGLMTRTVQLSNIAIKSGSAGTDRGVAKYAEQQPSYER